ncbi:MAG: L-histidine N(alpha)-methyltransferase [Pseudomonadota bacterium]
MTNTAEQLEPNHDTKSEFAEALFQGLTSRQKSIPCRFLYDAKGSQLFEEITRQPEYYPTRTEAGILASCAPEIAAVTEEGSVLIEFGSGSSTKTEILLLALGQKLKTYVPLDISKAALDDALERLSGRFPQLPITPITADFSNPIALPADMAGRKRIGFFPGSTIGNLVPDEAVTLLSSMRTTLGHDGQLIIGTDLVKPLDVLVPAYNDTAGVTAAFNLNVLRHANRVIGTDFKLENFRHDAIWNPDKSRMEMHLISGTEQTITGLSRPVTIAAGEHLHTENSHKYTIESFHALAAKAGWEPANVWTDDDKMFAVHALKAV